MKKALYVLANVALALVGGWWLAQWVSTLPYEMPSWLEDGIRGSIRLAGNRSLDNTDDIETIAILVAIVVCTALVGVVLALANWLGRQLIARRRRAS
ncbi:hypothetical protein [Paraburkholderia antibiotica]|uniref:Uncharacterized protein n=1 Tax=Paraburkholderia antibiotica TaxID=2728839 RepID=A0A7X9X9P1_9BURK|nr:hypothetical protein [Paraburkholderia antibiotica]NML33574.1 hypothetical protein [Paraburkholderia antibiotica]